MQTHTVGIKANTASSNSVRRCCHSCSKMLDLEPKKERVHLVYTSSSQSSIQGNQELQSKAAYWPLSGQCPAGFLVQQKAACQEMVLFTVDCALPVKTIPNRHGHSRFFIKVPPFQVTLWCQVDCKS